jgi:hypothetical protein
MQIFLIPHEISKNKAYQVMMEQRELESLSKAVGRGWNDSSAPFMNREIETLSKDPLKKTIYLLNLLATPALSGTTRKAAAAQTQVDQTLIACALERCRLAHGSYPASLDVLAPQYLTKLPNSPITGKPMNYSLKPDGNFLLWSPGWNLKSLGGKPGEYSGEGDIVWGKPLPKTKRPTADSSKDN